MCVYIAARREDDVEMASATTQRRSAPRDFYGAARRFAHKGDAAEIPGPRRLAHGAQNPNRNRPEASVRAESNTDVTPDLNGSLGPPFEKEPRNK
ncbi:hypothetical protein MRX96_007057 [Rhipicephalus microplus]